PAWLATLVGDQALAARDWLAVTRTEDVMQFGSLSAALAATAYDLDHDTAAASAVLAPLGGLEDTAFLRANAINQFFALPGYWAATEHGDWGAALADARKVHAWLAAHQEKERLFGPPLRVWILPLEALAQAKAGDIVGAEDLIAATPTDCYLCL